MAVQAAILDVDGTLVDSVDLHARAWQEAFAQFGTIVDFAEVRAQIGKGGDQLLPVFWPRSEVERSGERLSHYRAELFKEKYLDQVQGFPRVRELVLRFREAGLQVVLASSAKGDELQAYKKKANIEELIAEETSSDDAKSSKPHPDIFAAALLRLGRLSPEKCLVVGDTPYDVEAARKLGIRTVAMRCGGFSDESLRDAVAIYDSPADLLSRYETSPFAA